MKTKTMIEAGFGMAVVAALGAYFLYGKNGGSNRAKAAAWMLKMKGEVLEKAEEFRDINKAEYHKIVDEVAAHYEKLGKVGAEEVKHLAQELKDAWEHVKQAA